MDFSQYLQQYLDVKRQRGVTPGQPASTALFAPYFNRQYDVNMAGQRQDLAEKAQTFNEQKAGEALALQKYQTQAMLDAASKGDRNQMIGNVISTGAGLGNLALMKKYGYFDRRGY
jgi:hypothetical protein